MNHISALALANSINQERLGAAARSRELRHAARPDRGERRFRFLDVLRSPLIALRPKPQPSR